MTTNDGIVITRTSQKVSLLTIEALKARHKGNYTCYASNKGGVASHSAYLAINGSKKKILLILSSPLRILQFVPKLFFNDFFQVVPIIAPFTFGEEELNLDDSVTVTCSITKGDLPIKIWWQFNGEMDNHLSYNLTTNDGIVITRNSQKNSFLNIDAVKARHRGNYTCYAQNKGGFSQQSAYLAINGH